jgi:ADP-ribose pyrophosphatase
VANTRKDSWVAEYSNEDFEVTSKRLLAQSFFKFEEFNVKHKTFEGECITIQRDLLYKPNSVAVLLFDAKLKSIVLIEQFRIGAIDHPRSPWLLELVAGLVEPGESIEDVAKRETIEESGLVVDSLEHICKFSPSPGGVREYIDLYCAHVDASTAGGVHGLKGEGEDIKVHVFSLDTTLAMLGCGEIDNAPAIIALQWLQLKLLTQK